MAEDPLCSVIHAFEGKGFPFGLTARKLRERAHVVESKTDDEQVVFEMERHSGILGEEYIPGTAMWNVVTHGCRYVYDVRSKTLEETEREVIDVQVAVDGVVHNIMEFALSFQIEPVDRGFRVVEVVAGNELTVDSKDEFVRWARRLPESWDLSYYIEEAGDYLEEEEMVGFEERLVDGCKNHAERRAASRWERDVESASSDPE